MEDGHVDAQLCRDFRAMAHLGLTERSKLLCRPSVVATRLQPAPEHVDRCSQDDDAPTPKLAKNRAGQALVLVGATPKDQMPVQQELFATVEYSRNRPDECDLVLVNLRDLSRLGPGGVASLFAYQLACRRIAKPEPLGGWLRKKRLADAVCSSHKHRHGLKLRESRITSALVRYLKDWGARNP